MRQQEIKAIPALSEFPERATQNAHKPQREIRKRALGEIATTVKIVLTRRIGMIHHSLVFLAAFQAAREVTRNDQRPCAAMPLSCAIAWLINRLTRPFPSRNGWM
jgi:hypothetical protein